MLSLFPYEIRSYTGYLPRPTASKDYKPPAEFPQFHLLDEIQLDLETQGLDPRRGGRIVGIALNNVYYPIRHVNGPNCDEQNTLAWLRAGLKEFKGKIIGANVGLYDGDFLQCENIHAPQARWLDVQFAEPLLNEYRLEYNLDALGLDYLGIGKDDSLARLYGPTWKQHFQEIHSGHAAPYAVRDNYLAKEVLARQIPLLEKDRLTKLFGLECRLTSLLLDMKQRGVRVDLEGAAKLEKKLTILLNEVAHKLNKLAGFPVDYNSGPQMATACDRLGIPYERTEKGNASFRKAAGVGFDKWIERQTYEFLKLAYTARFYEDLRDTFVRGYILNGHINGRIHCRFHPLKSDEGGTVGSRFSSSDPNLQNIPNPKKAALGKEVRALFLPEEDMDWAAGDFSQIELRFLIEYALKYGCKGAEAALQQYKTNPKTDYHDMVVGLTKGSIPRADAKNVSFMIVYGGGEDKAIEMLGKPRDEVKQILEEYNRKVPFAKQTSYRAQDEAKAKGFVRTILGRKARFPEDTGGRRVSPHMALNRELQGSAGDLLKVAMLHLWERFGSKALLHVTVHDELGRSIQPGEAGEKTLKEFKEIMETALPLRVPVLAEVGRGKNWAEAKE